MPKSARRANLPPPPSPTSGKPMLLLSVVLILVPDQKVAVVVAFIAVDAEVAAVYHVCNVDVVQFVTVLQLLVVSVFQLLLL